MRLRGQYITEPKWTVDTPNPSEACVNSWLPDAIKPLLLKGEPG